MRVSKWHYIGAAGLIIVAALFCLVFLIMPMRISTDAVRLQLADQFSQWSGFNVALNSPPELHLFPRPYASIEGVVLTAPDDNDAIFMQAEKIEVDLSLTNALLGNISFSKIRLYQPQITLDAPYKSIDAFFSGLSSSQGIIGETLRATANDTSLPDAQRDLSQHQFGRLIIIDGSIIFKTSQDGSDPITEIQADIVWPNLASAIKFDVSAKWQDAVSHLTYESSNPINFINGQLEDIQLRVQTPYGSGRYSGKIQYGTQFRLDGTVSANIANWSQLATWIGKKIVPGLSFSHPITWNSRLVVNQGRIAFDDIRLKLANDRAHGALEMDSFNVHKTLSGSLAFDNMDVGNVLTLFFPRLTQQPQKTASFNNYANIDIRLSAPQARFFNTGLENFAASIQADEQKIVLDLGNAQLLGGTIQAKIQYDLNDQNRAVSGRFTGSNIDMASLIEAIDFKPFFNARANITWRFNMPLTNKYNIFEKMDGQLTLETGHGVLTGYNIDEFLQKYPSNKFFGLTYMPDSETEFQRLHIKANISDMVATINAAEIEFDQQRFTLNGIISLPEQALALSGTYRPIDRIFVPQCQTPPCPPSVPENPLRFFVGGSWEQPFISPSP